jgi:hypothetical protein
VCGLARIFESEGFATVLVGFVREHIEAVKPPRALWLNFPMGRPLGKPNDPDFQKGVIRAAFKLFEALSGPVLEDFSEVIPIRDGRMSYALPDALLLNPGEVGDLDALLAQAQAEVAALRPDYEAAKAARGRTTVGATELGTEELAPFIAQFARGEKVKKSPRKGVPPLALLKLAVEDLWAYFAESISHQRGITEFEELGAAFWENTKAARLVLAVEAAAYASDDKALRQLVDMLLITPRFWSDGGSAGKGW